MERRYRAWSAESLRSTKKMLDYWVQIRQTGQVAVELYLGATADVAELNHPVRNKP